MFNGFYQNKRVFVTGHTGFKGSWLSLWLKTLGAKVCGYSLPPNTTPSMFESLNLEKFFEHSIYGDILDYEKLDQAIRDFRPEIIFHLAAQPIVRRSYIEPVLTYKTNVIGSLNVLECGRNCASVKAFVNITTDKCYENKEILNGYTETDALGGYDMYSSSKACVEIMSTSFRRSFLDKQKSMKLATARAGNVIGGGDWAEDRLIPDCIKSINQNLPIEIRNPNAIRPWQHVLEPISAYLLLGQKLYDTGGEKFAQAFNFGPDKESVLTVEEIAKNVCKIYGKGEIVFHKKDELHEADLLMLNIEKSKNLLGWYPTLTADAALKMTVDWYKNFYENRTDMYEFTKNQIKDYEEKVIWNKSCATK